ncbi:MAG TPA: hypothetical protein ENK20_01730, partial [Chromatiales bacterium]|nr:hypothetical protein [Chromatiales bacterium]
MASSDTYQGAVRRYDPNGYLRHLVAGGMVAAGAVIIGFKPAAAAAVISAALAGAIKEVYDAATGRGHVDWLDAVF